MVAMFIIFIAHLPVRVVTPQIARLRYYACQNGISGGPLSSSLNEFDWRKTFIWRASDTEYRQRQFPQFFEVLTPRIYAYLYYWFGPFMWLPLCLLMVFVIGFMIAFLVRQWTNSWFPGLVAGSFWLMTPEVLVGHHAPMRYAKDFATIEILGIIALFLAIRGKGRSRMWLLGIAASVIWAIGIFTDEYILFTLPAFIIAILTWPWLKSFQAVLLISFLLLALVGLYLFLYILPDFISPDMKKPLARMSLDGWPGIGSLIFRNSRYLILNTWDNLSYTFGWSKPHYSAQVIPSLISGALLVSIVVMIRAWKGWGRMILFWIVTTIFVGGILLPEGNDILHQITYYNRPLIALLMIILGLFTANVFNYQKKCLAVLWLIALTFCAILNFFTITISIQDDPEEAYLTRYGLNNIIQLHSRLRSNNLIPPVFVSYPRFPDPVEGVYDEMEWNPYFTLENGFPWSLYRSIMPRLYLRHFEEGELRANPRQFARWSDSNEHEYRFASRSFYDMPAGIVWDLESIRSAALSPSDITWMSRGGAVLQAAMVEDLLGLVSFTCLGKGGWGVTIPLSPGKDNFMLVFALRHVAPTSFIVENAIKPGDEECHYRWSWQLFAVELKPGSSSSGLWVETEGEVEVIGPVIVPAVALAPIPPSLRKNVPPTGIPLLDERGVIPPGILDEHDIK